MEPIVIGAMITGGVALAISALTFTMSYVRQVGRLEAKLEALSEDVREVKTTLGKLANP